MEQLMRFDTKIIVAVRDDLAVWQKLNVTAFLSGGLGGFDPALLGEPYRDGSDTVYGPMIRQPILVFCGSAAEIRQAHARALERDVRLFIYTAELFATGHDVANRAAVAAVAREDLDLVGLAFHAEKRIADKIVKGLRLHP
jgi:hypothetical protein